MVVRRSITAFWIAAIVAATSPLLAQTIKETPLNDLPAVDADRAQPQRKASPPAPPPIPPAPRVSQRTAPPPADVDSSDDAAPPARNTPPPRGAETPARSYAPPPARSAEPRYEEPPAREAAPRYEEPPPSRRADRTRPQQPPVRSSFYANCTQQCHMACEASFEACNGDSSPAKAECVRKLEACRVERCSCRFDQ